MHRDQNLLFAVFAVQLKRISPASIMAAAGAWATNPDRGLPERLIEDGILSNSDCQLILRLVEEAVEAHSGDASAALETFGGDDQINQTFMGRIVRDSDGLRIDPDPAAVFHPEISIHEIPGRYRELGEKGRGGMGRVLLVHDEALGRDIVLKELLPVSEAPGKTTPARKSASMIARFLQEAKITGQLEHPGIAPVYELGYRFDGTLYYTMKFVRGKTLSKALKEVRSLRERLEILPHIIDLCNALAYAHSRGVLHRDLKPANIMLGEFGETVILDWGLAKIGDRPDVHADSLEKTYHGLRMGEEVSEGKTAPGEILGTPMYMAPEQARGELDKVDHRSDIYALGVLLYQLLTGKTPYPWTNFADVLRKAATEDPVPILELEPHAPRELMAICVRAMARRQEDRYQSARDLADELRRFLSGSLVETYEYRFSEHLARFARQNARILTTAALAAVCLAGLAAYSYVNILHQKNAAEEARIQAQREKSTAERERERAREATTAAEAERERAKEASGVAVAERNNAEAARAEATERREYFAYRTALLYADTLMDSGLFSVANETLWNAPEPLRNWEWGYLLSRANQDLVTFRGHSRGLRRAHFSGDDRSIITVSDDRTAKVWDASTGAERTTLLGHETWVIYAALNPPATRAITVAETNDSTARLWNLETGAQIAKFGDLTTFQTGPTAISPDWRTIATAASNNSVILWDVFSQTQNRVLTGPNGPITEVQFSPDGLRVAASSQDGAVRVWDADSGVLLVSSPADASPVPVVHGAFSFDGRRLYGAFEDGSIAVWDGDTGTTIASAKGHDGNIIALTPHPSADRFLTASADDAAKLWSADGELLATFAGHTGNVHAAAFSPDGSRIVTASEDKTLALWDAVAGTQIARLEGHSDAVTWAEFSHDGSRVLSSSFDGTAKLWPPDRRDRAHVRPLPPHEGGVALTAFASESPRAVSMSGENWDLSLTLWDTVYWREVRTIVDLGLQLTASKLSPDGETIYLLSGEGVAAEIRGDEIVLHTLFDGMNDQAAAADWSPGGHFIAVATLTKSARIWSLDTNTPVAELKGHETDVTAIRYNHDGTHVVTGDASGVAIIWDAATGSVVHTLEGHTGQITCVAYDGGGQRVLTASFDNTVRVWNAGTGAGELVLVGHSDVIGGAAFSPDGSRIVTASRDGFVKIWDAAEGTELAVADSSATGAYAVSWSPDQRSIFAGYLNGDCRVYEAAPWRSEALPGESSLAWRERYDIRKRDASPRSADPGTSPVEFDGIVAFTTRERLETRIDRLIQTLETRPASPENGMGWPLVEDLPVMLLRPLGVRFGDMITAIGGETVTGIGSALEALRNLSNRDSPPVELTILRQGREIQTRCRIVPRQTTDRRIQISRLQASTMLQVASANMDRMRMGAQSMQRAMAEGTGLPPVDPDAIDGLWVATFASQTDQERQFENMFRSFMALVGLRVNDCVKAVDGIHLTSLDTFIEAMNDARRRIGTGEKTEIVLDVERGHFHRLLLTIDVQ